MTDIVKMLRGLATLPDCDREAEWLDKAADEIERLRAEMAGDKILEDCEMHDPVWAAIAGVWGKRCEDFEEGCPCCRAWAEYDKITRLTAEIERLRAALEVTSSDCKEAFADNERLRAALLCFKAMMADDRYDVGEVVEEFSQIARAALEEK